MTEVRATPSRRQLFNLENKVAIVTGASKGIGEAIARGLAEFGAKVVVSSRKQDAVDRVAQTFQAAGLAATGVAAHMGSLDDIQQLIDKTLDLYGGVDIVVNNAAVNPVFGPIQNTDSGAFDKIIAVNLKGPFELCKRAHPIMKKRGGGSIINISSIGGIKPEHYIGIYSVSKAALISLTQVMAKDWGADNIRANVVCPGLIQTKFSAALWQNEAIVEKFTTNLPLGRLGQPEDMLGLAVFLASDASAYCSGGVYVADGGYLVV